MVTQLGPARANADERRSVEAHGLISRWADCKENDAASRVFDNVRLDPGVRTQPRRQPRQKILVALRFGGVGIELGSYDFVRRVVDAKQKIPLWFACQTGAIGKRGQVLA